MGPEKGMKESGKWGGHEEGKTNKVAVCLARQPLTPGLAGAALGVIVLPLGFSFLDESGTGPVSG